LAENSSCALAVGAARTHATIAGMSSLAAKRGLFVGLVLVLGAAVLALAGCAASSPEPSSPAPNFAGGEGAQ